MNGADMDRAAGRADENLSRAHALLEEAFGFSRAGDPSVTPERGMWPGWDSLGHVRLMIRLADVLGEPVTPELSRDIRTLGDLALVLGGGTPVPLPGQPGPPSSPPRASAGLRDTVLGETTISEIADGAELTYRGFAVAELVRAASFDDVLEILLGSVETVAVETVALADVSGTKIPEPQYLALLLSLVPDQPYDAVGARALLHELGYALGAHADRAVPRSTPLAEALLRVFAGPARGDDAYREADVRAFEQDLIIHAEHGLAASTLVARVAASAGATVGQCLAAAAHTFAGARHGGAIAAVADAARRLTSRQEAARYLRDAARGNGAVAGFGHAVYRREDPRCAMYRQVLANRSYQVESDERPGSVALLINARTVLEDVGLYPNVDLYSALLYQELGLRAEAYTCAFMMARISGWLAHIAEARGTALIRPTLRYRGYRRAFVRPPANLAARHVGTIAKQAAGSAARAPSLLDVLLDAARRTPDATAIRDGQSKLSYRELWGIAAGIRERLDQAGLPGGSRILLTSADRSLLIASLLGTLLGGWAAVVLPSALDPARRPYFLDAARPHAVVSDAGQWRGAAAVFIEPADVRVRAELAWQPPYRVTDSDPSYIVFTSGSTGRPKGVVLPHRSLRANIMWQLAHSGAAARRSSQYASVGFDSFISEVLSTLAFGGELCIVPEALRLRSADLLRWIADYRLTRVFLPYVGLQALASASTEGDPPLAVEQLYTAGEQLVVTPAIRALFRRHPEIRLFNRYGPSETHCVACYELDGPPGTWETRPPIGLPFGPCEFLLSPAEGGAEVTILGDPVGLGYLPADSPDGNRFGEMPASDGTVVPSYRTGDLMEYRDGQLYFVGRVDNQVKVRGFRLELEGVEALACQVAGVQYACAVIEPAPSGADVLRLALVVRDAASGDQIQRSVTRELARALPAEVLPQSYHLLRSLPITERGKVDRGAVLRAVAVFR